MTITAHDPWLRADEDLFRRGFDTHPFPFAHRLATHELFALDRLIELARTLSDVPGAVYYDAGDVDVDQRLDEIAFDEMPIATVVERIETARAFVLLRKSNTVPEYAAILEACLDQILAMSGRDLRPVLTQPLMTIVISSPHRVTPFHMDGDCNFLFQIRGRKSVRIFDRNDRDVLPEREIERYYAVDKNAVTYKPAFEERAFGIELEPGQGVHIPINAPHWVRNGPDVSVSISMNFLYNDEVRGDVYRANYWLRRLGLKPLPPERNPAVDGLKRTLYGSARKLRDVRRHGFGKVSAVKKP